MGGVVDCGVELDTKSSPRRAAIEKAQAELRQEYDVREERKRELEFLEKGGNPLDFKFGHAVTLSVQSTSLTDQLAEQYVTSEAKGSFALAASPHDSVESSGRPGGHVGREPNSADNLLLLDGENSNAGVEKNVNAKRTVRKGNAPLLERDGRHNAKGSEDSLVLRLGGKGQAYARRNRTRTSRDGHGNKSSKPSSFPNLRDAKKSGLEACVENNTVSSVSNSKPVSPNGKVVLKTLASDDQADMEVDEIQAHRTCTDVTKDGVQGATEVDTSDNLRHTGDHKQDANVLTKQATKGTAFPSGDLIGKEEAASTTPEPMENIKDISSAERVNGFGVPGKDVPDKSIVGRETEKLSKMKTDPSCASMPSNFDGNTDKNNSLISRRAEGSSAEDSTQHPPYQGTSDTNGLREKSQLMDIDAPTLDNGESRPVHSKSSNSTTQIKDEMEFCDNRTDMQIDSRSFANIDSVKLQSEVLSKPERKSSNSVGDNSHSINKAGIITTNSVIPTSEPSTVVLSKRGPTTASALQNSAANNLKLAKKAREDAILKEARIIEANLKKAREHPTCYMSLEKQRKCHWDFVLEEMAWMANDFMQERLWKIAAAAQVCHQIASSCRSKLKQQDMCRKQRNIARTLANAVVHFWRSADIIRTSSESPIGVNEECNSCSFKSCEADGTETAQEQGNKDTEGEKFPLRPSIQDYAVRFLKYNCSTATHLVLAEAPSTPDRINDTGILEMSWEDQPSEESLFYLVPPGAMQAYRESVESQLVNYKTTGNTVHDEDCEVSMCDSVADGPQENAYEEDEGETGTYFLPRTFEGSLSSKFTQRKKKHLQQKSYAARLHDVGSDYSYERFLEGKSANQSLIVTGKRPSNNVGVGSIPTKRVRTAPRQRVVSPFSGGIPGGLQVSSKTDASSGDTNSFQDDQSSLHGGSQSRKNMEVESTMDFDKQSQFDGSEISKKSKKKKKPKHLGYKNSLHLTDSGVLVLSAKGSSYEHRLQDSMIPNEQKDHVKKRFESQHFESNGNAGIYVQHVAKKPKLLKQFSEASPEAIIPATGSLPSPVTSQMSNMSGQHKFIKIIANRDRGKKSKTMKMAAGQSGSGISWSTFEDQALVVLVHDMGPNWELVSDAINSTLQFKCIFRKPKECKERHKLLMDKSSGDGADSADDSGSSQPYPSTLPGIPKGSARQLFQRLQGPLEEDTLKAHFEKIILIGQQLHPCRIENDNQERKQITPVHSSHYLALSQTCPNNLTGALLTPLDLCDAITSSPDVLAFGYQGSHTTGAAIPCHQGPLASVLPNTSGNSMLQASSSIVLGGTLPSPSGSPSVPPRDAQRYGVPRPASLPIDDQQRMQQYNQMLSGRNIQQSNMSVPGVAGALPLGVDRGVRMLPGGNGMGMMCGINRTMPMPMPRPGFQGMSPPGMLNIASSGSMLPATGVGVPTTSVHPAGVPSPGSSMLRPRDPLQMLRPGQNTDDHRQMIQDLQLQVSQGNGQPVPPFNAMSAPFPNPTVPASVQNFPAQQHQQSQQMLQQPHMLGNSNHPHMQGSNHSGPQHQAYAMRLAKERQLQQRARAQPQHHLYPGSTAMSPMQNNSQLSQQTQLSSPAAPSPPSQPQHKQHPVSRNPQSTSGMSSQMMKQRQRQQAQQQQPRHQQQQKQLSQQQAKLMKGLGRGTMLMHQNLQVDASHVSGLPATSKNQVPEKHLIQQGQGFFSSGGAVNPTLPQSSKQHKLFSRPPSQPSKQLPPLPSQSDACNQGSVQALPDHTLLAPLQPPLPSSLPLTSPQQQQQQRQMNGSQQNMQRIMHQQNRQLNSDVRIPSSMDQVQGTQIMTATSVPQCTDVTSSNSAVSSVTQWKPEPLYDTSTPPPAAHLDSSPQENLMDTDTSVLPSSQGLAQRPLSGSAPMHGHVVGGPWQQQQQPQPQPKPQPQPQQPQHQHQHQHRQVVQGNLYARPSNSGPG